MGYSAFTTSLLSLRKRKKGVSGGFGFLAYELIWFKGEGRAYFNTGCLNFALGISVINSLVSFGVTPRNDSRSALTSLKTSSIFNVTLYNYITQ